MILLGDNAKSEYLTPNVQSSMIPISHGNTKPDVNKCSVEKLSESINQIEVVSNNLRYKAVGAAAH